MFGVAKKGPSFSENQYALGEMLEAENVVLKRENLGLDRAPS